MRRLFVLLILALPAVAQRPVTIEDALRYRNVTDVEISPDARRIAYVVSEADFDENTMRTTIHLAGAQSGSSIRLTNAPKHDTSPRWSPDGKLLAFISDRAAKPENVGKRQVWLISPDGGEAWQLTREKWSISSLAWAPDGKRLAVVASEAETEEEEKRKKEKDDALLVESDLKPARIYFVSVDDGKSELLYGTTRHVSSISVSPTGQEIAFADQPTPKIPDMFNSVVRVLDVESKQVRTLSGADHSASDPKFSPNGRHVVFEAFSPTDWASFGRLYVAAVGGGTAKPLTFEFDEEIRGFDWLDDSTGVVFSGPRGVDQNLYRVTLDGKIRPLFEAAGVSREPSVARGRIAFLHETPTDPVDVHFGELPSSGKLQPKRLSDLNPQIRELQLARTEVVRWKNRNDGRELDGLLVKPIDYVEGRRYPLLVVIHGGPAGQFNRSFTMRRGAYPVQLFAARGYAVFLPNPRGSGGYGEKFRRANVKDWGNADYFDIQHGVDELISRGIADSDRMGIMGWSYGGFMTSWTITQTNRFKAASVGAGVTNLFSFYGTTDIPPFIESYWGARPWQDRELMATHSAMYFIDRVKTPTLIQHGTEDRRVPISQGEELYTALRTQGVPTEMIRYPRTEHGITEPKLIRDAMTRNLEWFDRYLRGDREAAKWHRP